MKFYRLSGATFYDRMNTIYQFIKPFLDNEMSNFEEYGTFNCFLIPNVGNHVTEDVPEGSTHILVNAYMRSGSSFATEILTKQPSTFYFYEPLFKFSRWGYFTGDGQLCNTLVPTCRSVLPGVDRLSGDVTLAKCFLFLFFLFLVFFHHENAPI